MPSLCHVVGREGGGASSYYASLSFCVSPAASCDPAALYWTQQQQQYDDGAGLRSNNTGCAPVNDGSGWQVPCDGTLYTNQQGSGGFHEFKCICDDDPARCPANSQTAQSAVNGDSTVAISAVPTGIIDPFDLANYTTVPATATSLFSGSTASSGSSTAAGSSSSAAPSSAAWTRSRINNLALATSCALLLFASSV